MSTFSRLDETAAPPVSQWELVSARWENDALVEREEDPQAHLLYSPWLTLEEGWEYSFRMTATIMEVGEGDSGYQLSLHKRKKSDALGRTLAGQEVRGKGKKGLLFNHIAAETGPYRLVLSNYRKDKGFTSLKDIHLDIFRLDRRRGVALKSVDTFLPNWGFIKRGIHSLCKKHRGFNAFVAGMEMRLGREESLSLPMFVNICPTGQCNALCGFCSVSEARDGIIKKQTPFENLERLLSPMASTVYMFGLEGNGEPTLYSNFDELVEMITAGGSTFYLITNGARLTEEQVDLLLAARMNAINFSLNAATAGTHHKVMKLKEFDKIVSNIKRIVDLRGQNRDPSVSVSFVVTNDNIHETVDFIRFAEHELKADRVYVRPLSEIATDMGAVEDFRSLVPYECDIRDMLDRVSDYLTDVPRREYKVGPFDVTTSVYIEPSTFRAARHDPIDRVVSPKGWEGRLLAPGRNGWSVERADGAVTWRLDTMNLSFPNAIDAGPLVKSSPIPVETGKDLSFRFETRVTQGSLKVSVETAAGALAVRDIHAGERPVSVEMTFNPGDNTHVWLSVAGQGGAAAEIVFDRVRTHGRGVVKEFKLPSREKWEKQSEGAVIKWRGNRLHIKWDGPPGPYLIKSYSTPCWPNETMSWPVNVKVIKGRLGLGVLSSDFQRWTNQFKFNPADSGDTVLNVKTQDNQRLQVALYSCVAEPLEAEVDWGGLLEGNPPEAEENTEVDDQDTSAAQNVVQAKSEPAVPAPVQKPVRKRKSLMEIYRSFDQTMLEMACPEGEKIEYYCQKPWTDLSNLSPDGRVDVCCIATGPSQQKYALGNLFTQDFQQIWNGESMKRFRATVNSGGKLPPCQRCPMAYAYQGMYFDPSHTVCAIYNEFLRKIRFPIALYRRRVVGMALYRTLFKGFRKTPHSFPH